MGEDALQRLVHLHGVVLAQVVAAGGAAVHVRFEGPVQAVLARNNKNNHVRTRDVVWLILQSPAEENEVPCPSRFTQALTKVSREKTSVVMRNSMCMSEHVGPGYGGSVCGRYFTQCRF